MSSKTLPITAHIFVVTVFFLATLLVSSSLGRPYSNYGLREVSDDAEKAQSSSQLLHLLSELQRRSPYVFDGNDAWSRRAGTSSTKSKSIRVYHGTTCSAARNISKNGFMPSTSGLLGPGVYVSEDFSYAKSYAGGQCVIVAYVNPGKIAPASSLGYLSWSSVWQFPGYDSAALYDTQGRMYILLIRNPKTIKVARIVYLSNTG